MTKPKREEDLKVRRQIRFSPGMKFGLWTAIQKTVGKKNYVDCICECGTRKSVCYSSITDRKVGSGSSTSCGCFQRQDLGNRRRVHGMAESTEYETWCAMKTRCTNPNDNGYKNYGGRGIKVCAEWMESFEAFFNYIGKKPSGEYSIDRFPDKNGNYEPGNVRWATQKEQMRNVRTNHIINIDGVLKTLVEWREIYEIKKVTVDKRLKAGWDPVLAVTTPVKHTRLHEGGVEFNGERKTIREWSEITGITRAAIQARLLRGWTIERTLTQGAVAGGSNEGELRITDGAAVMA